MERNNIHTLISRKNEYDFTDAEQGKFYRPMEELEIPIYRQKYSKSYYVCGR